ncbi:MAG: hypothetical protein GY816_08825 [Cytophagales bacterium]|nr:hypothetical protein [Cytophagales bacterium]
MYYYLLLSLLSSLIFQGINVSPGRTTNQTRNGWRGQGRDRVDGGETRGMAEVEAWWDETG